MPCNNVISYQWIDPPTSNVKHLRIFYGLDSKVQIKTVPQELTCAPATNPLAATVCPQPANAPGRGAVELRAGDAYGDEWPPNPRPYSTRHAL